MQLTIATWNLAHRKRAAEAVEYLETERGAEIILLQEMPTRLRKELAGTVAFEELGIDRGWGTAIFSRCWELEMLEFESSYPGCMVATSVDLGSAGALKVISLYGLLENGWRGMPMTLHRMLSDLTPVIMRGGKSRQKVILGGDFNASTQLDNGRHPSSELVFDRIEDFGLKSCAGWPGTPHIPTYRHPNASPYQLDYLFASDSLRSKMLSVEVIDNGDVRSLSDHSPIVATFEL